MHFRADPLLSNISILIMNKSIFHLTNILFFLTYFGNAQAQSGTLDNTFGIGGRVTSSTPKSITFNSSDICQSLTIQPDGKILAAGFCLVADSSTGRSSMQMGIKRFNSNGTIDATFGLGGHVITSVSSKAVFSKAYSIKLQNDGKIVIAGTIGSYDNQLNQISGIGIVRYKSNGTLDSTFGTFGTVCYLDLGEFHSLAIQGDSKLVVAGFKGSNFILSRFNPDGTNDNSFGDSGTVNNSSIIGLAFAVAIQKNDGKIIVAGINGSQFALARYNINGGIDNSFGTNGIVNTLIGNYKCFANSVVIQNDGKIVAGGFSYNGTANNFALARYNTDGTLDSTFGNSGKLTTIIGNDSRCNQLILQTDNKIVAAGQSYDGIESTFCLTRYNKNGILDNSFGTGGKVTTSFGTSNCIANSIAIQNDGKIIAGGEVRNGPPSFALARYNNSITGINETINEENILEIYPNPNNGILSYRNQNDNSGCTKIEIYNIHGEIIYSSTSKIETSIDISNSPSGVYFIRFYSNGNVNTKRITKL